MTDPIPFPQNVADDSSEQEGKMVQLLIAHQSVIRGRVIAMLPGKTEVDDIIQEINLVIWKKRESFEQNTNFKAWVNSIVRYEILTYWRDQQRSKEFTFPEDIFNLFIEESSSQIEQIDMDSRLSALRHCLSTLRLEDRALILQRHISDQSITELSQKTNRSSNSLRVTLHRIRASLRLCIGKRAAQSKILHP